MKPSASDQNPNTRVDHSINRDSVFLTVGTAVSAKYRGAFCEATVDEVNLSFRLKVQLQNNKDVVSVDQSNLVSGSPLVNNEVTVRVPCADVRPAGTATNVERVGTVLRVTDTSLYTVVFDDGDKRTLRRTQLVIKGERHFKESESLDCLPLTNPEQFRQPVIDRRKHRSGNEDSEAEEIDNVSVDGNSLTSEDREEHIGDLKSADKSEGPQPNTRDHQDVDQFSDVSEDKPTEMGSPSVIPTQMSETGPTVVSNTKGLSTSISDDRGSRLEVAQNAAYARLLGRLVLVNMPFSSKDQNMSTTPGSSLNASDTPTRRRFSPCLVVLPTAMPSIDLRSGSRLPQLLVRSFKDNRFFAASLCNIKRLKRPTAVEMAHAYPSLRTAFERALLWLDRYELPVTWGENATQSLLGVKNWRAAKREQRAALANAPKLTKASILKSCKIPHKRSVSDYSSVSSQDEVQASTPVKRNRTISNAVSRKGNTTNTASVTNNSHKLTKLATSRKRSRQSDTVPAPSTAKKKMRLSGTKLPRLTRSVRPNSGKISVPSGSQQKRSSRKSDKSARVGPCSKRLAFSKEADSHVSGDEQHSSSLSSITSPSHSPNQSIRCGPLRTKVDSSSSSSSSRTASDVSSNGSFSSATSSPVSSDTESSSSSSSSTSSTGFEARDRWIAQLYRFMDEGGTPINKAPCLANKDLDLYKLYKLVKELGGFHRVTAQMKWGYIYSKLHLPQHFTAGPRNLQAAFKRYLYPLDDISRKLGTELDELPLARPRHQLINQTTITQSSKAVTPAVSQMTSNASRQSGGTSVSTSSSTTKTQTVHAKSNEKASVVLPTGVTTITTPNSKDCSSSKPVTTEPTVESTSFSSPPVLSPLLGTHEHSSSPESTTRKSKSVPCRDVSATSTESLPKYTSPSTIRVSDKTHETDQPRKRSFADVWKSNSTILKLPSNRSDSAQINRVIPIGSRVRVRCGDRVAYEAKVLKHIRPQPDLCLRGTGAVPRSGWSVSSELQYRVHYMGWNRRHDEVVSRSRIISIVKWARPADSLRPPSCSSLNLIVQEPRSKLSSSRDLKKLSREDSGRSSGRIPPSQARRSLGPGGIGRRGTHAPIGGRRQAHGKTSPDMKDNDGQDGDDERDADEDDDDDGDDDDDNETNGEEGDLPEYDSDQSQTTETASDIVTTLAPIVRRRRMMFGQPIPPNKRTRARCFASSKIFKDEPVLQKRPATRNSLIDEATTTNCGSRTHSPINSDRPDPTRVKPEPVVNSRTEPSESTNLPGKRARLNAQLPPMASEISVIDSKKASESVDQTPQNNQSSTIKPEEKPKTTSHTRSSPFCEAPKGTKAESIVVQKKRKNGSASPVVRSSSKSGIGMTKSETAIVRDKKERPVLKRHVTYGAKRISVIKGEKLRSLKRMESRDVASIVSGPKRPVVRRSTVVEITTAVENPIKPHEKKVLENKKRIQKKQLNSSTEAVSDKTEAVRLMRPIQARARASSTELAKPVSKSLQLTAESHSVSDKPECRSVSPTTPKKPLKAEVARKLIISDTKGTTDTQDRTTQSSKARPSKPTLEAVSSKETHNKSDANTLKARQNPKASKSSSAVGRLTSTPSRPRSNPSKRATVATRALPQISRTRSNSSSSSTSASTSLSAESSDDSVSSHETGGKSLSLNQSAIRESKSRRVNAVRRGPPSLRYSRNSGSSHHRSRSNSISSSSSASSDYGNTDALPRLTRSQHRQLLGDTPPGAVLQTASPVGATTGTGALPSISDSATVKPEPQSKDMHSKSSKFASKESVLQVTDDKVEHEKPNASEETAVAVTGLDSAKTPVGSLSPDQSKERETEMISPPPQLELEVAIPKPSETAQPCVSSDTSEGTHSSNLPNQLSLTKLRSRAKARSTTITTSIPSGVANALGDSKSFQSSGANQDGDEDDHKGEGEDMDVDEDEQSSVHTVSTDPMKGALFDLTMSPVEGTPIRSSSLSVSSSSSLTSSSASDSEIDGGLRCRRLTALSESAKLKNESSYRSQRRESLHDDSTEEHELNEEIDKRTSSDVEDHEDDNVSVQTETSRRSGQSRKRADVSIQWNVDDKSRRNESDSVTNKTVIRTTERRRRTSVSSSTDNATVNRKGMKRHLQGTPLRSLAFDRSPTPTSDSPHYPNSPTTSSLTVTASCPQMVAAKSTHFVPRMTASQRRFGGPFFPIQGLNDLPAEAKCQLLQDRMHQIVEAWRLAKQYLKDLDQRTNRTRRLRARHAALDTQTIGNATPNSKITLTATSDLSSSGTGPSLDAGSEQQRLIVSL